MAIVTGTFSGTGQSAAIAFCHGVISMDFSGTASVDVEEQIPTTGSWIKIVTGITADYRQNYDSPVIRTLRLNCTAYTNNVEYSIEAV
jgi:hypothetical protein